MENASSDLSEDESIDLVSIQGAGGLSSSSIDDVRFDVGGLRSWPRQTTGFFITDKDIELQSLFLGGGMIVLAFAFSNGQRDELMRKRPHQL